MCGRQRKITGHITNGTDIDEEDYWRNHGVYQYDKDQDCGDDVNEFDTYSSMNKWSAVTSSLVHDVAILYVAMI
jgi:hypothetical protein